MGILQCIPTDSECNMIVSMYCNYNDFMAVAVDGARYFYWKLIVSSVSVSNEAVPVYTSHVPHGSIDLV